MCRNIVPLNNLEPAATDEECHDAAVQQARSAERYEAIRIYQQNKRSARGAT